MSAKSIGEYQAEIADLRRKLDEMARIYQGRERYEEYVPEPERRVDSLIAQINRILNPKLVPLPESALPEQAPCNFTEVFHGVAPEISAHS